MRHKSHRSPISFLDNVDERQSWAFRLRWRAAFMTISPRSLSEPKRTREVMICYAGWTLDKAT
jgi:hypothetical protein